MLRNRVRTYLINNQYIESHYQKGFMPGMSGTFEHIAEISHILNHSIKQQRSVTITLIDLKNAFGEVHHSLIQSVLCYHYRPDEINCIVKILYDDFHLSIITNDFHTKCISVVRLDDCFTYLGGHFDFKMSDDKHKSELTETITGQIEIIDELPLHPRNKLKLYKQWKLLKVSWQLTVTKILNTWMKNKIDTIVLQYIRLRLEIPVNGTSNIVTQSKRKFGLGVILASTRHTQCQVTFRNKLRKSGNHNIREIHK